MTDIDRLMDDLASALIRLSGGGHAVPVYVSEVLSKYEAFINECAAANLARLLGEGNGN